MFNTITKTTMLFVILGFLTLSAYSPSFAQSVVETTPKKGEDPTRSMGNLVHPGKKSNKLPQIVITVDPKGDIDIANDRGTKFKKCVICSKGDGERCARHKNVCRGLVNATVIEHNTFTVIGSKANPYCWTVIENGVAKQQCVCAPGEEHEMC